MAGSFYRVLVDRDPGGLWHTVWLAAALYLLTSVVQAVTHWLSELVAARSASTASTPDVCKPLLSCFGQFR